MLYTNWYVISSLELVITVYSHRNSTCHYCYSRHSVKTNKQIKRVYVIIIIIIKYIQHSNTDAGVNID